ncbi:MAG: CD225/dispanin family protein [bacterium]|nr:CD225/dispanin family protein [bacterium]
MGFCGNCGAAMGDNDKFCGKCGAAAVTGGTVPASIKAPSSADPKLGGLASKPTSALPSGASFAPASPALGGGLASKPTSALPSDASFAPASPALGGGLASKPTSALPSNETLGQTSADKPAVSSSRLTSVLSETEPFAAAKTAAGAADSETTVALLNVNKRPGYEASNAYLDGKSPAVNKPGSSASSNPFGSSSSPFGRQGSAGAGNGTGGNADLPVFGAGAAASAAFSSGGQKTESDSPSGYPFGNSKGIPFAEPNGSMGPKSSDLGPFSGGPVGTPEGQGIIGLKTDNESFKPSVAVEEPRNSLVGGRQNPPAAEVAVASAASAYVAEEVGPEVHDYLIWSIIVLLCCCQPMGIASVIFSAMCRSKKSSGDFDGAMKMSMYARICNIVGLIGGGLIVILYALMMAGN